MYRHNQLIFPSNIEKDSRFFVLAGFSMNGPVGTPFMLRENADPYEVIGDCRMLDNYLIAKQYGIDPLILRLNGSHGEAVVLHEQTGTPALRFRTLEATDESNNIHIHVFPTHMVIEGLYRSYSYYFQDYQNLNELKNDIMSDLYWAQGELDVEILNRVPIDGFCLTEQTFTVSGADDGFNYITNEDGSDTDEKVQMQIDLIRESLIEEDGYFTGELSGFDVDTLLFTDIAYERANEDLISIFGSFAKTKTNEQNMFCSVVFCSDAFKEARYSLEGEDGYQSQVDMLLSKSPVEINEMDYLSHLEVVVGTQGSTSPRSLTMPCAASYASMRYALSDLNESATNKEIASIDSLHSKELLKYEVANLSGNGYICIVPSIKKGFVPFSSKNLYPQDTLKSKSHYLRSVHYDVGQITSFFNRYIGEPMNFVLLQSILTEVQSFLQALLTDHPIYKNIEMEVLDYTQSDVKLAVEFEFYGEIESVRTSFDYESASEVNVIWL